MTFDEIKTSFKENLKSKQAASITVRSYLSDVNHFLRWLSSYAKENNLIFYDDSSLIANHLTTAVIEEYKKYLSSYPSDPGPCLPAGRLVGKRISWRRSFANAQDDKPLIPFSTINRRLSAIRKFCQFLITQGYLKDNPAQNVANLHEGKPKEKALESPESLREFKQYLWENNVSPVSIKNYLSDLNQFVSWLSGTTHQPFSLTFLTPFYINEYKNRLFHILAQAPNSINRKLSSLRAFCRFAQTKKGLNIDPFDLSMLSPITNQPPPAPKRYSFLPPVRLAQRTIKGLDYLLLSPIINGLKSLLSPFIEKASFRITNIPKEFYAPVSLSNLPLPKKIYYYFKYTRPKWYKNYKRWPPASYLNLAVLILFCTAVGFGLGQQLFGPKIKTEVAALPTTPPRFLAFQGRLTDENDTPINTPQTFVFKIYDALTNGTELWTESKSIEPDTDGIFSTLLGDTTDIEDKVFRDNSALWLEVSVGGQILSPRQRIATVAYALNAEYLQGYPASTSAIANTIPVVDENGALTLAASSPTFQATSGNFTIKGQVLTIQSSQGQGGLNISDSNTLEIKSASGAATLRLDQLGTGDLFTASASGVTKATLTNTGSLTLAGNLTAQGILNVGVGLTAASGTITNNLYVGSLSVGSTGLVTNLNADYLDGLHSTSFLQVGNTGAFLTGTGTPNFLSKWSAATGLTNSSLFDNGALLGTTLNMGVGTTGPKNKLDVSGSVAIGTLPTTALPQANSLYVSGNVGIGTTNPTYKLYVNGNQYVSSILNVGVGVTSAGLTINGNGYVSSILNIGVGLTAASGTITNNLYVGSLSIGSTGRVANLNADYLDGLHSSSFLQVGNTGAFLTGTGTPNFLSKWSATTGLTNSSLFDNGALLGTTLNMGVGTTGPKNKLDVSGSVAIGALPTTVLPQANMLYVSGNVGIGTTSPGAILNIGNTSLGTGYGTANEVQLGRTAANTAFRAGQDATHSLFLSWNYNATPANATAKIGTYSYSNPVYIDGSTVVLQSQSNGNVGIGTTSPTQKLDVSGSAYVSSILNVGVGLTAAAGTITNNLYVGSLSVGSTGLVTNLNADYLDGLHSSAYLQVGNTGAFLVGSGTPNFISKWSAATGLTNSSLFDNGTTLGTTLNMGVGTTGPKNKLDVSGSVAIGTLPTTALPQANMLYVSGNVGIGTTSPAVKLNIAGGYSPRIRNSYYVEGFGTSSYYGDYYYGGANYSANNGAGLNFVSQSEGSNTAANINFSTKIGTGDEQQRMTIQYSGNVGIGTVDPTQKLDVTGSAYISSILNVGVGVTSAGLTVNGNGYVSGILNVGVGLTAGAGTITNNLYVGSLSIGTTGLVTNLNADYLDGLHSTSFLQVGNTGAFLVGSGTPNFLSKWSAATGLTNSSLFDNGTILGTTLNMGVGTTGPKNKLDVSGSVAIGTLPTTALPQANSLYVSGNVGIGTTNPTYKLYVSGNQYVSSILNVGVGVTSAGLTVNGNGYVSGILNVGVGLTAGAGTITNNLYVGSLSVGSTGLVTNLNADYLDGLHSTSFLQVGNTGAFLVGSGTPNFISKWSAATGLTNSSLFDNGALLGTTLNMGVGTTGPKNKLDVSGSVAIGTLPTTALPQANSLYVSGNVGIGTTNPTYKLYVSGSAYVSSILNVGIGITAPKITLGTGATAGYILQSYDNAGNAVWVSPVGIGGTYTANNGLTLSGSTFKLGGTLSENTTIAQGNYDFIYNLSGTGDFRIQDNGLDFATFTDSGNIGLGITAPSYKFQLQGSVGDYLAYIYNVGTGSTASGLYIRSDGEGNLLNLNYAGSDIYTFSESQATFNAPTNFTASGDVSIAYDLIFTNPTASYIKSDAPLYIEAGKSYNSDDLTLRTYNAGNIILESANLWADGTNVGIGTTSPSANLDVVGNAWLRGASEQQGLFVNSSGFVGAGNTNPSYQLDVAGDGYVSGILNIGVGVTAASGTITNNLSVGSLSVGSTGLVANLNADYLDGLHSSSFLQVGNTGAFLTGTGTPNFISKWSAATGLTNSSLFDNGTLLGTTLNMGVGTTGPKNKLDVSGSVAIGTLPTTALPQANSLYVSGNVGIGTTGPGVKLDVAGAGLFTSQSKSLQDSRTGAIFLDTNDVGVLGRFTYSGNQYYREIIKANANNQIEIGNSTTSIIDGIVLNAGDASTVNGNIYLRTSNADRLTVLKGGSVGIGTTAPVSPLHIYGANVALGTGVEGQLLIESSDDYAIDKGGSLVFRGKTTSTGTVKQFGSIAARKENASESNQRAYLQFNINNSGNALVEAMRINSYGNVGIGTVDPTQKLDVSGSAYISSILNVGVGVTSAGLTVNGNGYVSGILNVGVGLTAGAGTITNNLYVGSLSIGTTGLVTNLNADYLDGLHSTSFLQVGNTGAFLVGSGTPNFLSKWSAATGLTNSSLFDNGTILGTTLNMGVGTTGPKNKLDVSGSVAIGALPTTVLPQANMLYVSGNVGIGTTRPTSILSFGGTEQTITMATADGSDNARLNLSAAGEFGSGRGAGINMMGNENANKGYLQLVAGVPTSPSTWFHGAIIFNTGGTNNMVLDRSGNVGIGTTAPTSKLHVVGSGYVSSILNVGVGVTSAGLTINGNGYVSGILNVGVGLTAGAGTITNNLYVGSLSVGSTGLVTNLNADYLDGLHSTSFLQVGNTGAFLTGTGTPNFLSKWSAATGLTNSSLFDNGTTLGTTLNMGVGTTGPKNKLDVSGSVAIGTLPTTVLPQSNMLYVSGNVGIGTTSPTAKLAVEAGSTANGLVVSGSTSGITNPWASTRIGVWQKDTTINNMAVISFFNSSGYDSAEIVSRISDHTGQATGNLEFWTANNASSTVKMVIANTGSVGIGTTGPEAKLSFGTLIDSPAIYLYQGSATNRYGMGIHANEMQSFVASTGHFSFNKGGDLQASGTNELMRIDATTGNVGIGTTNPTSTLYVSGSGYVSSILNVGVGVTSAGLTVNGSGYISSTLNVGVGVTAGAGTITNNLYVGSLSVGSTGRVTNLNADYLDGLHSSSFLQVGNTGAFLTGTGTPNFISKWSAATGLTNSSLFDNGTLLGTTLNMGVGTTGPKNKLDVSGSVAIGTLPTTALPQANMLYVSGNVGIGTTGPGAKLHVYNGNSGGTANANADMISEDSGVAAFQFLTPSTQSQSIYFGDNNNAIQAALQYNHATDKFHFLLGGFQYKVTIDNSGNVGIGTVTPTNLLSLGGTAARTFWMERNTTTNSAGNNLTVQAGGATSGMVSTVSVVAGGVGYSPADVLTLATPDGGTAATVTVATIAATGGLKTLAIVAGGTGYTPGTNTLTVVQAGASLGTINCTADAGGIITSINSVTTIGSGYSVATPLATTGGGNNDCTVNLQVINGAVATVTVTTKGALYTTGTKTTTVEPAGGTGATIGVSTIESATDKAGGALVLKSGTSTGTGTGDIQFWTSPAGATSAIDNTLLQRMTILGSGNIGIGTTAPLAEFHIYSNTVGANPAMLLAGPAGGDTDYWLARFNNNDSTDNDLFIIGDGTTPGTNPFLTINTSGNVGIGTTNPTYKLYVVGSSYVSSILNVGVGLTSAGLTVNGSGYVSGILNVGVGLTAGAGTITNNLYVGSLSVGSTGRVANLNADYLDGLHSTSFLQVGNTGAFLTGTGTPNFISKWSAATGLTNSSLFDNGTTLGTTLNMGVGTTGPKNKLDVSGSVAIGTLPTTVLPLSNMLYVSGNVGIGTTRPVTALDVSGVINASTGYRVGNAAASGNFLRGNGTNFVSSAIQSTDVSSFIAGNPNFVAKFTGANSLGNSLLFDNGTVLGTTANVGIGTTSPTQKLYVSGSGYVSSILNVGVGLTAGAGTITNNLYVGSLSVGSTGLVTNLNADYLDGLHSSSFLQVGNTGAFLIGTGTPNFLSKWSAAKVLINSSLFDNGTTLGTTLNMGVGTTGPKNKLDVSGSVAIGTLPTTALPQANSLYVSGNVGIGTTNPTYKLYVVGSGYVSSILNVGVGVTAASGTITNNLYVGSLSIGSTGLVANLNADYLDGLHSTSFLQVGNTGAFLIGTGTPNFLSKWSAAKVLINSSLFDNGTTLGTTLNMGVGTTGPKNKLDVSGSVAIGTLPTTALPQANSLYVSGNVGIGTTNPTYKLYVNGDIAADIFRDTAGPSVYFLDPAAADTGNSLIVNGKVGIGTTNPTYKFDVEGAAGAGYLAHFSNGTEKLSIFESAGKVSIGAESLTTDLRLFVDNNDAVGITVKANGGNVGIGTTGPNTKLHIVDTTGLSQPISSHNLLGWVEGGTTASTNYAFTVGTGVGALAASNSVGLNMLYNVGSGTAAGQKIGGMQLIYRRNDDASAVAGGKFLIQKESGSDLSSLRFFTNDTTEVMTIKNDGSVGIGTTGPEYKLVVADTSGTQGYIANFSRNSRSFGIYAEDYNVLAIGTDTATNLGFYTGAGATQMTLATSGSVGIGTTNPQASMDIRGNLRVGEGSYLTGPTADTHLAISNNNINQTRGIQFTEEDGTYNLRAGIIHKTSNSNHYVEFTSTYAVGSYAEWIFATGNVGLGLTNPSYRLQLPNIANATGRGQANEWPTYSSIRWKENITPITDALEKISLLNPVYFDWKAENGGTHSIGLIAEEVGLVIPEVVNWDGNTGYATSMDYARLSSLTIKGIQEQQLQIASLSGQLVDLRLTDSGDFVITNPDGTYNGLLASQMENPNFQFSIPNFQSIFNDSIFKLKDSSGNLITRIGKFSETMTGKLQAGIIQTADLITQNLIASKALFSSLTSEVIKSSLATIDNLIVNQKITSPLAEIETIKVKNLEVSQRLITPLAQVPEISTNLIKPISNGDLVFLLTQNPPAGGEKSKILVENDSGETVAMIDSEGNASFSGQLTARNLETQDATIAGILRAKKILAEEIIGATISANYITNITNIYNSQSPGFNAPTQSPGLNALNPGDLALTLGPYVDIATLSANMAHIRESLSVLGTTLLSQTSIMGMFSQGGSLVIDNGNQIEVLSGDLYLQKLRQGGVNIANGKLIIDKEGNLLTEGNLTVKGVLSAKIISPLSSDDLIFRLSGSSEASSSSGFSDTPKLLVKNASGSAVLTVNQTGDLIASGSAVAKELVASTSATAKEFKIIRDAQADSTPTQITANASVGSGKITSGQVSILIKTPYAHKDSLIYLTPVGQTEGKVLFLANLKPEIGFTVGIDAAIINDLYFNWWIVN